MPNHTKVSRPARGSFAKMRESTQDPLLPLAFPESCRSRPCSITLSALIRSDGGMVNDGYAGSNKRGGVSCCYAEPMHRGDRCDLSVCH